ncbi:murein L,D-transpeptidase YafK [Chryseobacterium camelliae]|nr:murein L,D-transpeptidase YafK [Chryseobacterium camelliae]
MKMYKDNSGRRYQNISEIEAHSWSKKIGDKSADANLKFYTDELKRYNIIYKPKNVF